MADTIITVRGEYELRHAAERGAVRLLVSYDGEDREETLALTTQRHISLTAKLRELHRPHGGPVTRWSSDQLRVWGERPWNQEGRQLPPVFHAQVGIDVTFDDLAALSDWVGTVSLLGGVTMQGVTWSLSEARRQALIQDARRRAVENAVAKATVYATSLGLSTVRPLAISDPGMLGDTPSTGEGAGPLQPLGTRAAAELGAAALSLKPEEITIGVRVDARFSAS